MSAATTKPDAPSGTTRSWSLIGWGPRIPVENSHNDRRYAVGSYWPYATTVWDHIRRTMPYTQPGTLTPNETYSVTAYILFLNGIVDQREELNEKTLPKVRMPNRDGFVRDPRPDTTLKAKER